MSQSVGAEVAELQKYKVFVRPCRGAAAWIQIQTWPPPSVLEKGYYLIESMSTVVGVMSTSRPRRLLRMETGTASSNNSNTSHCRHLCCPSNCVFYMYMHFQNLKK